MLISSTTIWNLEQKVSKKLDWFNLNCYIVDLGINRAYFGDLYCVRYTHGMPFFWHFQQLFTISKNLKSTGYLMGFYL